MNELGQRITIAREAVKMNKSAFARAVGVSAPTVTDWESGEVKILRAENMYAICEITGRSSGWFLYGLGEPNTDKKTPDEGVRPPPGLPSQKVPLIDGSEVANIANNRVNRYFAEKWLFCNCKHSKNTFALVVEGESMVTPQGTTYPPGCIIFIDPEEVDSVESGDPVVAFLGEASLVVFRCLIKEGGQEILKPLNERYPLEFKDAHVVGKVIEKLEWP